MSFRLSLITMSLISVILGLSFTACSKKSDPAKQPDYPINQLFLERSSYYDLHRTLSAEDMNEKLKQLFEAARWAPSCYNNQPWRYIYGIYGTPAWDTLYNLLVPFNQGWVKHAGALILVVSKNTFDRNKKPTRTHSFDTGLATAQLLLQATTLGLVAHPMSGFDYDKAAQAGNLSDEYTVEAMIAIGERATAENSHEEYANKDVRSSKRKPIVAIASEGRLP